MNCPDRQELVATLADLERSGEPSRLLAHIDRCSACRRLALEVEPSLLFRRLAEPVESEDEVARMREAVRTLIRSRQAAGRIAVLRRKWGSKAAVGLLAGLAFVLGPRLERFDPDSESVEFRLPTDRVSSVPTMLDPLPSIEDVGIPGARIYQLQDEGLSIVMIVDESLDL